MNLKPGDKVMILNESGIHVFIREQNKRGLIFDEFGFEREIDYRYLVKFNEISTTNDFFKPEDKTRTIKVVKSSKSIPEIDLHIEALLEKYSHLTAHEKLLFQIDAFKKFTNQMLNERNAKFRVIHGGGSGKLKFEITLLIKSKKGFRIHDDTISRGVVGVSLIEVFMTEAKEF